MKKWFVLLGALVVLGLPLMARRPRQFVEMHHTVSYPVYCVDDFGDGVTAEACKHRLYSTCLATCFF